MPTRIIREGIISSERVNLLSQGAELFYRRLMSVVDDYGRYYSHPSILRSNCYPLKLDTITDEQVSGWLTECVNAGLVVIYNGGKHLCFVDFKQQTRSKSKFPDISEQTIANTLLINCKAPVKRLHSLDVGVGVGEGEGEGVRKKFDGLQADLCAMFSRSQNQPFTYAEQTALLEVSRRPEIYLEVKDLAQHKDDKYFPRSLESLLTKWQPTLDRYRNAKRTAEPKQLRETIEVKSL